MNRIIIGVSAAITALLLFASPGWAQTPEAPPEASPAPGNNSAPESNSGRPPGNTPGNTPGSHPSEAAPPLRMLPGAAPGAGADLPKGWEQASLAEFTQTVKDYLHNQKDVELRSATRQRLADVAWERFFNKPAVLRDAEAAAHLTALAEYTRQAWSDPQQETLRAHLLDGVAADAALLKNVSFDQFEPYRLLLRFVSESVEQRRDFDIAWMQASEQWRSLAPGPLRRVLLTNWMTARGSRHQDVLDQLLAHAKQAYVANLAYFEQAQDRSTLFQLASWVGWCLAPDQREAFVDELWDRYVNDRDRLTSLRFTELQELRLTLYGLTTGPGKTVRLPTADWVNAGDHWRSLDPMQLSLLVFLCDMDAGMLQEKTAVQTALSQVAEHAWLRYLADSQDWAPQKTEDLFDLALTLQPHLSIDKQKQLIEGLTTYYVDDAPRLTALSASEAGTLNRLVVKVNNLDRAALPITAKWLWTNKSWRDRSLGEQIAILKSLAADPSKQAKQSRDMIQDWILKQESWKDQSLSALAGYVSTLRPPPAPEENSQDADPAKAPPPSPDYYAALRKRLKDEAFAQWRSRTEVVPASEATAFLTHVTADLSAAQREELKNDLLSSITGRTVAGMTSGGALFESGTASGSGGFGLAVLVDATLLDLGVSMEDLAEISQKAYVIWRTESVLPPVTRLSATTYRYRGYNNTWWANGVYSSAADPAMVRSLRRMMSYADRVNPLAVMTLAWHYNRAEQIDEFPAWKAFLHEKAQNTTLTGDQRAQWFVALAFVTEVEQLEPLPLRGRPWLEEALGEAESDELRQRIMTWLIQGLAATHRFDEAESILASAAPPEASPEASPDPEVAAHWADLLVQIGEARQGWDLAQQQHQQLVDDAWRNELQRRLDKARQDNDDEQIQRVTRLLANQPL